LVVYCLVASILFIENDAMAILNKKEFVQAGKKSLRSLASSLPILIGVILLTGWVMNVVDKNWINQIFHFNPWLDAAIGSLAGSLLAGNPTSSYVLGGELLQQGVSLAGATAFIVAWVTVGVVQFPAESMFLGVKFSVYRNLLSFVMAILIGFIMYMVF